MKAAAKVHHEIAIRLTEFRDGAVAAKPSLPPAMSVGESISFASPDGSFRVEYTDGAPFGEPGPGTLTDSRILTLVQAGNLEFRCFLKPPTGNEIGWSPEHPESGGAQDVRP